MAVRPHPGHVIWPQGNGCEGAEDFPMWENLPAYVDSGHWIMCKT